MKLKKEQVEKIIKDYAILDLKHVKDDIFYSEKTVGFRDRKAIDITPLIHTHISTNVEPWGKVTEIYRLDYIMNVGDKKLRCMKCKKCFESDFLTFFSKIL